MERKTVSLSPILSIIAGWYGCGRSSLSISHVCVGGEADPSTIFGTEEEPAKKKDQPVVKFQTTEDKLVAVYSSRNEDA